jgi:hypothetical protein
MITQKAFPTRRTLHQLENASRPRMLVARYLKNGLLFFTALGACRLFRSTHHRCPKGGVSKFQAAAGVDSGWGIRARRSGNPGPRQENRRSHGGAKGVGGNRRRRCQNAAFARKKTPGRARRRFFAKFGVRYRGGFFGGFQIDRHRIKKPRRVLHGK